MAKRSFYISEDIDSKLSNFAKKTRRSKSFIICQALEMHLAEMSEDAEDYNECIAELNKIEAGEQTISWQEVQRKNGLTD